MTFETFSWIAISIFDSTPRYLIWYVFFLGIWYSCFEVSKYKLVMQQDSIQPGLCSKFRYNPYAQQDSIRRFTAEI